MSAHRLRGWGQREGRTGWCLSKQLRLRDVAAAVIVVAASFVVVIVPLRGSPGCKCGNNCGRGNRVAVSRPVIC